MVMSVKNVKLGVKKEVRKHKKRGVKWLCII